MARSQRKRSVPLIVFILIAVIILALLAIAVLLVLNKKRENRTQAVIVTPAPVEVIETTPEITPAPTPIPTPAPTPSPTPTQTPVPKEIADFAVPADRNIVLLSYYNIAESVSNTCREVTNDTIKPAIFEQELQFIHGGGYDTIWFEDLGDLGAYDKPVIISFDGSYSGVYTDVLPLIKKYDVKITLFVNPEDIGKEGHLSSTQLTALLDSGLVSLQAGASVYEDYVSWMPKADLESKLQSMRRELGELSGRYPIAFAYPAGSVNRNAIEAASDVFRFCVRRSSQRAMNTSKDDFSMIYRYTVDKDVQPGQIEGWLGKLK